MNPLLDRLQPYPFERLRALLAGVAPPALSPIRLSIGEPQHATPDLVRRRSSIISTVSSVYPATAGLDQLREAMAAWFRRRYALPRLDAATQVLPVNGTREALFAFAQAVIDASRPGADRGLPEPVLPDLRRRGAAGRRRAGIPQPDGRQRLRPRSDSLTDERVAPHAAALRLLAGQPDRPRARPRRLARAVRALRPLRLRDRVRRVLFGDLPDEEAPPLGALEAAHRLGRDDFRNLVVFTSLSKRSNAPGLRSGGVAGDAALLKRFLLYRTYHGCAMSLAVQHASIAAWSDEAHVRDNRAQYREKFAAVVPMLEPVLQTRAPDAGFYLWARVPGGDDERSRASCSRPRT